MSVLYLIYAIGGQVSNWLNLFFLSTFTLLIFSFGIVGHIRNYNDRKYFSRVSWLSAITINIFGVFVLLLVIAEAFL